VNYVVVDWRSLAAAPWYDGKYYIKSSMLTIICIWLWFLRHFSVAASGTQLVGQKLGSLLDFLVKNGYTTADKIHLLGHSLGSHVIGFAGANFQALNNGLKIARISGTWDFQLRKFLLWYRRQEHSALTWIYIYIFYYTALDPALPRFGIADDNCRVDPTDAEFVDGKKYYGQVILKY
jgi:hypothetical protein